MRAKKHDEDFLNREFDFSKGKRAKDIPHLARLQEEMARGKTRITIYLDNDVLAEFRARAGDRPPGYQTLINEALREHLGKTGPTLDEPTLRRVVREELERSAS